MDVPLQQLLPALPILANRVSILVLMDVPLQHNFVKVDFVNEQSFNPCFNGCSSSTYREYSQEGINYQVSILVLMDVPLQHFNHVFIHRPHNFVSILVLMDVPLQRFVD